MAHHIDENEQWEAIKKWWKENGTVTIIIFLLAASGSFGFRYWQEAQARKHAEASALYDQLGSQVANSSPQVLAQIAKELETNYTATPYASLAALLEAKNAVEKNDLTLAMQKLQWVIEHANSSDLRQIARLRAARVLLAQKQPAQALLLLEKVDDKAFMPGINQVKGDIYLFQGDKSQARLAYSAALANLPPACIKILGLCVLVVILAACHRKSTDPMAPLTSFNQTLQVQALWSTSVGSGVKKEYLHNTPAIVGNVAYVPDYSGRVTAVDTNTGRRIWVNNTKTRITTGASADNGQIYVGTKDAEILALNTANGKIMWRTPVSNEVLATPNARGSYVIVKSSDDNLYALDKQTGKPVWNYKEPTPALSLRGAHSPQVVGNLVVVGFANGQLGVFNINDGTSLWKRSVALPQGMSVVEQMVDINGSMAVTDSTIYVATYQGVISAINLRTGQSLWEHDISSYAGVAVDANNVYVTDSSSHVLAFNRHNGALVWQNDKLNGRNLTEPAIVGNTVVVADGKGYVHWLSAVDGHFIARTKTGGAPILAAPIAIGSDVYVYTSKAQLVKYRV